MKEEFRRIADLLGQEKASAGVTRELEEIVFPRLP
jgi:hypothetical protein